MHMLVCRIFLGRSIVSTILAVSEHFELMIHNLKLLWSISKLHRAKNDRVCLLAIQADHMMVMMMFTAMCPEFHAIFKNDLLQYTQFLHYTQIAVYGVKA